MLSLSRFLDEEEELLPLGTRMKAKNYWAFVLPALVRHRAMSELLWEYGILMKKQPGIYDDISEFVIKDHCPSDDRKGSSHPGRKPDAGGISEELG